MNAATESSLFERIGGEETISELVDRFYAAMDSLPQAATIRAMHDPDLAETKRVLKRYLAQWLGGPDAYSAERGHPQLRRRHLRFPIDSAARDAWMLCMGRALEESVRDEAARGEIFAALARLADWMRNREDG